MIRFLFSRSELFVSGAVVARRAAPSRGRPALPGRRSPIAAFLRTAVCLPFLCSLTWITAQNGPLVKKIEVKHIGPPAASDAMIRANIRVKVGDVYKPIHVQDDVRNLVATGLFHNVGQAEEATPDGIILTYIVQGKPILTDIRFEGNKKYSHKKLSKKMTSKTGEPLDERKLFLDAQEMQKTYQKAGYQKTTVRYLPPVIDESAGRGTVTFEIKEAPKIKIKRVEFVGANAFPRKKLHKVIKTRRRWMFSWITGSGVLKDEQFEEDKEKLADFYRNEGYIDFELKDVQFEMADANHMVVRLVVFEGNQYKVGALSFKGNTVFSEAQILQGIKDMKRELTLTVGAVFTPKALVKDLETIRDFYGAKGYIDTYQTGIRANRIPNTEKGTMDIAYEISEEDRGVAKIEKIEIRGNTKTKDKVIRRELAVAPGEVFDMVRVKRSRNRLEQMQYFDKVETEIEPTDVSHLKNLVVNVDEGNTGNVEFGAGFSSVDNLVGFIGYREGNFDLFNPPWFRGGGQKLRINLQLGTRRKDFIISFTEPWFLNQRLSLGADLYWRELNYYSDVYDISQTGARLSLSKALGTEFLIAGVSYTIEDIGVNNVDRGRAPLIIQQEEGNRLITKFGASLAYDTRNKATLPDAGQRSEILSELAGPFGGETDFYKFELRTSWYFPGFFQGHVLQVGGRAGVVNEYGRSDRVPLFDRFFLGGVYSLRGYKFRQVGPHDGDEPIGGNTYWFGTLEYSIPIIERLRFALFYDIGNVYEDAFSFDTRPDQKTFNDNWGLGFRLNIPRLGPLRLDYGIPITHDRFARKSGRFQFSVGFDRDF